MKGIDELTKQLMLLNLELEEGKKIFKELSDKSGISGLSSAGRAWMPVSVGREYVNSLNSRIVEITRQSSGDEEEDNDHSFEPGGAVMFFNLDEDGKFHLLNPGKVSYVDSLRMGVEIGAGVDLSQLYGENIGVMVSLDIASYTAMSDALRRTINAKGRLGELRDLIYSNQKPTEWSIPGMGFKYLNESQARGVNKILRAKDVAIVHGPPGTGKTTTLVEAIYETLRREPQVLVCAQSNLAVDWICEKLIDRGVTVLRIGNPRRITDKILPYTYEHRFGDHPDCPQLVQIRREIDSLRKQRKEVKNYGNKMARLRERAVELQIRINNDIFASSNVVACTLVGSDNKILDGRKFTTLFIDEAAQALEAACWIPMRRAQRLILAGDHLQLPPTVKCYEAMRQGLGITLMERIAKQHPECVVSLETQYRMHRDIMEFPNRVLYHGRMKADLGVADNFILPGEEVIEWIDTSELHANAGDNDERDFKEKQVSAGGSRVNNDEALLSIVVLMKYIRKIGEKRIEEENIDFGLISPYRGQVKYLRKIIKRLPQLKKMRKRISINTVDGFQGQERDVILISTVRSNDEGSIGFLGDIRRMNVAMTRARRKLLIIGNSQTLKKHRFYRNLHEYVYFLKANFLAEGNQQ